MVAVVRGAVTGAVFVGADVDVAADVVTLGCGVAGEPDEFVGGGLDTLVADRVGTDVLLELCLDELPSHAKKPPAISTINTTPAVTSNIVVLAALGLSKGTTLVAIEIEEAEGEATRVEANSWNAATNSRAD